MIFPKHQSSPTMPLLWLLAVLGLLLPATASADTGTKASPVVAKAVTAPTTAPSSSAATVVGGEEGQDEADEPFPITGRLAIDTTFGLGGLAPGEQSQPSVAVTFWPTIGFRLPVENLSLSASITATVYALNNFGTSYPNGQLVAGDLYATIGHTKVFQTDAVADGLTISAFLRVYFPTSPTSQLLNRILTIRPSATATLKAGPFSFSYSILLAKYFASSTTSTLDCTNFRAGQCIEGRPQAASFKAQTEGDQVALTGSGNSSFYVANAVSVGARLYDGLSLTLSGAVYNLFGFNSYPEDALSSDNAKTGRNQTDRLILGAELAYAAHKHFTVSLGYSLDTARPFGSDGSGLDSAETASSVTLSLSTNL